MQTEFVFFVTLYLARDYIFYRITRLLFPITSVSGPWILRKINPLSWFYCPLPTFIRCVDTTPRALANTTLHFADAAETCLFPPNNKKNNISKKNIPFHLQSFRFIYYSLFHTVCFCYSGYDYIRFYMKFNIIFIFLSYFRYILIFYILLSFFYHILISNICTGVL